MSQKTEITWGAGATLERNIILNPTDLFLCMVQLLKTGIIMFLELMQKWEFALACVSCYHGISC